MNKDNMNNNKLNRITRNIRNQIHLLKRTKAYRSKRNAFLKSDSKSKYTNITLNITIQCEWNFGSRISNV